MKRSILLVLLAVAPFALAQKPSTPPADKPKTTELQDTQLELYIAKVNEIQTRYQAQMGQESAPWVQKASALIDTIQKNNPEFIWHQAVNQQDRTGWIRKPPPAPTTPAPAPPVDTPAPTPAAPAATTPKK